MPLFKAALTRGAVPVIRDTVEITDKFVIYRKQKNNLIGFNKIVIPISKVATVEINSHIVGTDISVKSFGEGIIVGHRFALKDANAIKSLIEKKL